MTPAPVVPECLGCALLEIPERCVEWESGEVRCDECGEGA
jgi:hypothetical protein